MTKAEREELEALRKYRIKTEQVLHVIYDLLYFDPETEEYDEDKEWDSAADYVEKIADEITSLMGKPKNGTTEWPPIAGLPAREQP